MASCASILSDGWHLCSTTCQCSGLLQAIRKGNYPVVVDNHTLILNWNSQTVPLLRQIAINKAETDGAAYSGYALSALSAQPCRVHTGLLRRVC